ncbi:hypothetical protein ACP70R_038450 [Stipagrostis hirtigluma subsp. patula]
MPALPLADGAHRGTSNAEARGTVQGSGGRPRVNEADVLWCAPTACRAAAVSSAPPRNRSSQQPGGNSTEKLSPAPSSPPV